MWCFMEHYELRSSIFHNCSNACKWRKRGAAESRRVVLFRKEESSKKRPTFQRAGEGWRCFFSFSPALAVDATLSRSARFKSRPYCSAAASSAEFPNAINGRRSLFPVVLPIILLRYGVPVRQQSLPTVRHRFRNQCITPACILLFLCPSPSPSARATFTGHARQAEQSREKNRILSRGACPLSASF